MKTGLSHEWAQTHSPYEVIAKVSGDKVCYPYDNETDYKKVMEYISMAYHEAFDLCSENIILLKDGAMIQPKDILEVKSFNIWH